MAKNDVLVEIKVDSKDAQKSVEKFTKSTEKLSTESKKAQNNIGKKLSKNVKESAVGVTELSGSFGMLGGSLGKASGGIGSVLKGFKALMGNPIVLVISAIVLALKGLYDIFTSTKEGAEKMEAVFAVVGSVMDVIRDRALKLMNALKLLLSGEFTKASEEFKGAVSGIADEMMREGEEAYKLTRLLQKLKDQQRDLSVETAKQNKQLAEARLLAQDDLATFEDRLGALDKVSQAETDLLNKRLLHAKQTLEAQQKLANQSDSDAETLDKLAELEKNYYNLQTDSINKQKAVARERTRLLNEQEAEEKRVAEERKKILADAEAERVDSLQRQYEFEKQKALIHSDTTLENFMIEQAYYDKLLALYDEDSKAYEETQRKKLLASEKFSKDIETDIKTSMQKRQSEALNLERDIINIQKVGEETRQKNAFDHLETLIRTQQDKIAKFNEYGQVANEVFGEVAGAISEAINRNLEEQTKLIDASTQKQNDLLDNRLKRGVISERQAEKEREKINKEAEAKKEKLQKDAFEKKKKLDITQAIINTALSVSGALSAGFPLGLIMAGIYGALGGVQIATIKNQKFAKGGVLSGASHQQGGIPTPYGELEGGEAVINKRSTALFRNELSAINEAGGGVRFARGGVLGERSEASTESSQAQAQATQQTIKAYVVSNDMTTQQRKDEAIQNRASF